MMCNGLIFAPRDHNDAMWDTWLVKNPKGGWMMNYLVKHHSGRWNAVSSTMSVDGAHWADLGVAIRMDCANKTSGDCAGWLGSGSVWKLIKTGKKEDGADDEWVMNYSQQYDCGGGNCQSIFFATSKAIMTPSNLIIILNHYSYPSPTIGPDPIVALQDLVNWTPVAPDAQAKGGLVFQYNSTGGLVSDYARGRWDCIAVLPKPGGGYYGYWTANPTPQKGNPAYGCPGGQCGAGFGESEDGLHWKTLPTPGPNIRAEVGGLAEVGGKTWMVFDAGHLFEAPGPTGPFTAVGTNYDFLTQEGGLAFPRLWGELYTGDKDLILVTHQQVNAKTVYLGMVKQVVLGVDGVLRACWWSENDVLKGPALAMNPLVGGLFSTAVIGDGMISGLWLEGTIETRDLEDSMVSGVWLGTSTGGFGLTIRVSPTGTFNLGAMKTPGAWDHTPLVVDRDMHAVIPRGTSITWKAVCRNSWAGEAMVEFYVNDVVSLPYGKGIGTFNGSFKALGSATITSANRLSLPGQ